MSLTTTTLSSAVGVNDTSIVVASATGFAAGNHIQIDQEILQVVQGYVSGTTIGVLRGRGGTATAAHAASANVTTFLGSDETSQAPQTPVQWPVAGRARTVTSYSASGAITLPAPGSDAVAVLNGTNALTMTVANPTKDMDGCELIIIGNGKAAHIVSLATSGYGAAGTTGYTKMTYASGGQNMVRLMAANGIWVTSLIGGTATNITTTIS